MTEFLAHPVLLRVIIIYNHMTTKSDSTNLNEWNNLNWILIAQIKLILGPNLKNRLSHFTIKVINSFYHFSLKRCYDFI